MKDGLGIYDADEGEIELVVLHPEDADYIFADMVSRRAQIGWSTHGHSAVDVNIYGSAGSEALRGNHENTEIGKFLQSYLGVDVDAITRELIERPKSGVMIYGDELPAEQDHRKISHLYQSFKHGKNAREQ